MRVLPFITLALLLSLAFSPSATAQRDRGRPANFHGYEVLEIEPNLIGVRPPVPIMGSHERLRDLALLRLADEAVRRGFTHFTVLVGDDRGMMNLGAGERRPSLRTNLRMPPNTVIAMVFRDAPRQLLPHADVREVVDAICAKHRLSVPPYPETLPEPAWDPKFEVMPLLRDSPTTDAETVTVRHSFRNRDFEGILMAVHQELEAPGASLVDTDQRLRQAAAKIGAHAVVTESDPVELVTMGVAPVYGFVAHAYALPPAHLGVQWEPGPLRDQKYVVRRFYPDSLAPEAGMRIGDVVLEINGIDMLNAREFERNWLSWTPRSKVTVTVVREGREEVVEVEVIPNGI